MGKKRAHSRITNSKGTWKKELLTESRFILRHFESVGVDEVIKVFDHHAPDQLGVDGDNGRQTAQVTRPKKSLTSELPFGLF